MVLAAVGDGLYKLLYLGHMVSFLVAFAPLVRERRVHLPALIALGGFGLAMMLTSDPLYGFDQTWVSLAFLVWLAMCGLVSALIIPAERKLADGDRQAAAKVARGGQLVTLLLLVMLYLMIWKPGA
jgi:uncharacterized membrane protein